MSGVTTGMRVTLLGGSIVMAAGAAVTSVGVFGNDPARSVGGSCLMLTGLIVVALACTRRWVADTHAERDRLAGSIREAEAERARYMAAQAAMEVERVRTARDVAAEHAQNASKLDAERAALDAEFEDKRAEIARTALTEAVGLLRGKIDQRPEHERERSRVLQFPTQVDQVRARDAHN